jgi:hypothetical protein
MSIFPPATSWQEQVTFQWDDDDGYLVLDHHASSIKQQPAGRHVAPLGHIILIPS